MARKKAPAPYVFHAFNDDSARLLAQADVTEPLSWEGSPEAFKERYRRLAEEHPRLVMLVQIEQWARRYRRKETDGTPRLWRGKELQDIANKLDAELEAFRE